MSERHRGEGLYGKFLVRRMDGRDTTPLDKHYNCFYFVLDLDHDPFAIPALSAYADACEAAYPKLAADLREIVAKTPPTTSDKGDGE